MWIGLAIGLAYCYYLFSCVGDFHNCFQKQKTPSGAFQVDSFGSSNGIDEVRKRIGEDSFVDGDNDKQSVLLNFDKPRGSNDKSYGDLSCHANTSLEKFILVDSWSLAALIASLSCTAVPHLHMSSPIFTT